MNLPPVPEITIGQHKIGEDHPAYFIADVAANHDGELERAKDLIHLAAEAGAELLASISPNLQMINEALFDKPSPKVIAEQRRFFKRLLAGLPEALARLPAPRKA